MERAFGDWPPLGIRRVRPLTRAGWTKPHDKRIILASLEYEKPSQLHLRMGEFQHARLAWTHIEQREFRRNQWLVFPVVRMLPTRLRVTPSVGLPSGSSTVPEELPAWIQRDVGLQGGDVFPLVYIDSRPWKLPGTITLGWVLKKPCRRGPFMWSPLVLT